MANPRISVEITASEAKFREDLGKAVKHAEDSSKRIGVAFSGLKGLIQGAIGGLSFAALIAGFKAVTGAAESLGDLADATGSSVEDLSRLSNQAAVAGGNFEDFEAVLLKFSTKLGSTHDATDNFSIALQRLGVTSTDPAKALQQTILGLDKFTNGATKAAYAKELFDKSGARFLATLTDMARLGDVAATVTTKQADEAEKLNQALRRLSTESTGLRNAILTDIVPALSEMLRVMRDSISISGDLFGALRTLAQFNPFASAVENVDYFDKEIKKLEDTIAGVKAAAGGFWAKIAPSSQDTSNLEENVKKLKEAREVAIASQLRAFGGGPSNERVTDPNARPKLPPLPKDLGAINKAILDQALKALDDQIRAEQEILKDREHFLQTYYQDDELGLREYFERRQSVIADSVQKQIALYDKEIAALKAAPATTAQGRIENETKIADVIAKRAKLEQDAAVKSIDLWFEQRRAAKEFRDQIEDISIALQQMAGDSVGAGLRAFDKANEKLRNQARQRAASPDSDESAVGNAALRELDTSRARTKQQLELNKAQSDFRGILDEIAVAQGRINVQQQLGNITTLDAINQRSKLAQDNIARLQQEADAYQRLANELPANSQAQQEAIRNVQRLRLEIEQLQVAATELERTFREIFVGAVSDGLTELITGTKSVKDAFRDMERSIVQSISRIASQNIAESIFGKSGAGGGVGGAFASLFSGNSGGDIGDLVVKLFGAAGGVDSWRGGPLVVGERGPEIVNLPRGAQVIPNDVLQQRRDAKGSTIVSHITVNVPQGTTRESADQIALRTGASVNRSLARNG